MSTSSPWADIRLTRFLSSWLHWAVMFAVFLAAFPWMVPLASLPSSTPSVRCPVFAGFVDGSCRFGSILKRNSSTWWSFLLILKLFQFQRCLRWSGCWSCHQTQSLSFSQQALTKRPHSRPAAIASCSVKDGTPPTDPWMPLVATVHPRPSPARHHPAEPLWLLELGQNVCASFEPLPRGLGRSWRPGCLWAASEGVVFLRLLQAEVAPSSDTKLPWRTIHDLSPGRVAPCLGLPSATFAHHVVPFFESEALELILGVEVESESSETACSPSIVHSGTLLHATYTPTTILLPHWCLSSPVS